MLCVETAASPGRTVLSVGLGINNCVVLSRFLSLFFCTNGALFFTHTPQNAEAFIWQANTVWDQTNGAISCQTACNGSYMSVAE